MNTRKTILHQVCAALPLASTPAMPQANGLVAGPRQPSRSRLAMASALGLGMCGLFLFPGCQVVSVSAQDADGKHCKNVPGIPFVSKKVVRKQETVWQQKGILVSLTLKSDPPANTRDLGFVVVGESDFDTFTSLLPEYTEPAESKPAIASMTKRKIQDVLKDFFKRPSTQGFSLVSNKEIRQTVFDDKRYFITMKRPLTGPATFAPKFNTDAMLTEFTATVEDKTIPTLLEPFKDALSTLAKGVTRARDGSKYRVKITKTDQKIIQVITVTTELTGTKPIGKPTPVPDLNADPYPLGVEVVISIPKPDDRKAEDDKGAIKFSGSVLPPKADK